MKALINKILGFVKLHKIAFISGFAAAVVLAAAFAFGGTGSSPTPSVPQSVLTVSHATSDEAQAASTTTATDGTSQAAAETKPTSAEADKASKASQAKTDDASSSAEDGNDAKQSDSANDGESKKSSNAEREQGSQSTESGQKDKYLTDPIPSGKPKPVEPQDQVVEDKTNYCTLSISCATILDNMDNLLKSKVDLVPEDGWLLKPQRVEFNEGESVYDVLLRVCKENEIHMEASWTPIYNSAYIEGIGNLYEFDCGYMSGWMYKVNDWFPNYGSSRYELKNGDVVEFKYTCNGYGADIGADMSLEAN